MSIMKEQFKGKITRRAAMKTLASAGATAALAASAAPFVKGASTVRAVTGVGGTPAIVSLGKTKVTGAALCPPLPTDWTGRNTQLHRYDLAEVFLEIGLVITSIRIRAIWARSAAPGTTWAGNMASAPRT